MSRRTEGEKTKRVQFFIQLNTCYSAHTPYLPEVLQKGGADQQGDEDRGRGERGGDVEEERGHLWWVEMGIRRKDGWGKKGV